MNVLIAGFNRMKFYMTALFMFMYAVTAFAQSAFMTQHFRSNEPKPRNDFLKQFPYQKYLKNVSFSDIKQLEADRLFLNHTLNGGDDFLYQLCDYNNGSYPVTAENIERKITIGEKYLDYKNTGDSTEIYSVIGYFILGQVAKKLEYGIQNTTFDVRDPENKKLISRLSDRKVFICTVPGNLTKAIVNFRKGNFKYVFLRTYVNLEDYFYMYYEKLGDAFWFLMLFILFFTSYLIWAGGKKTVYGILILIILLIAHIFIRREYEKPDLSILENPALTQRLIKKYFYTNNTPAVRTYGLITTDGKTIGESIWLTRKDSLQEYIDAHYFAAGDIVSKHERQKKDESLIIVSSGGFNNILEQPDGFTVEGGAIINTVISPYRHGLVMLSDGGINVLNLKNSHFTIPSGQPISNPLTTVKGYAEMVKWAKKAKATVFQTQLLCYQDSLLITIEKAKRELRERRLLAICTDKKSNTNYYVIFNIRNPCYLAEITMEIFSVLSRNNTEIKAILNLDTGSYDILELYDESGHVIDAIKGTVDISKAINLISFTKKLK
ncbi:MAG: hypothetical protein IPM95_01600 [Sphingobacteriales bacterium]|nr:hypothetical protein [Sphingobacteriales bacterium]